MSSTTTADVPAGEPYLSHSHYGKASVRVLRVVREGAVHRVVEYSVTALLEGDVDVSYTEADNSVIVATDSIKNITYYLAKTSPHVLTPELFALHIGTHLLRRYAHMHHAHVSVEQLRWARLGPGGTAGVQGQLGVEGQDHPHAFVRDGEEKRSAEVKVDAKKGKDAITATVTSGLRDLLLLKTTGSAFESFIRDEYTTLAEVNDRILSTSVELAYTFAPFPVPPSPTDKTGQGLEFNAAAVPWDGDAVAAAARRATIDVFAADDSASVQATLYKMGQAVVRSCASIERVRYALPNKHYVPVDMKYIGVDNMTPSQAEVFVPLAAPSGVISATISRK